MERGTDEPLTDKGTAIKFLKGEFDNLPCKKRSHADIEKETIFRFRPCSAID